MNNIVRPVNVADKRSLDFIQTRLLLKIVQHSVYWHCKWMLCDV